MSKLVATSKREVDVSIFDHRSAVPFGVGLVAGTVGVNMAVFVIASLGVEAVTSRLTMKRGPRGGIMFGKTHKKRESFANASGDVLSGLLGWWIGGRWLKPRVFPSPDGAPLERRPRLGLPGGARQPTAGPW